MILKFYIPKTIKSNTVLKSIEATAKKNDVGLVAKFKGSNSVDNIFEVESDQAKAFYMTGCLVQELLHDELNPQPIPDYSFSKN